MRRYFVSEMDDGGGGWKVGNRKGYKTQEEAISVAERLSQREGTTLCVDLYDVVGDERDHLETIGYFGPDTD